MTPEGEVMAYIRDFFKFDRGVYLRRNNVGAIKRGNRFVRFGEPGESDWTGIVDRTFCPYCGEQTGGLDPDGMGNGIPLFIEAKSARGRLTPEQKEFLGAMRRRFNAIAIVARPVPGPGDPTGFKALRKQLERIRDRPCIVCKDRPEERSRKDREQYGKR